MNETHNEFICNLAADDAKEKAEEDGVVGEDGGEGGNCQTGEDEEEEGEEGGEDTGALR